MNMSQTGANGKGGDIIKSTLASVQQGGARADGSLQLTATTLDFSAFNKQFGLGPYSIALAAIAEVTKCWGKGGGILPVTSDGIEITLKDGRSYQFILANPDDWIALLRRG
ncbi:hypothetical protein LZP73_04475 [Shewanella sp. AS16]|uniref:hypothetical protein n=1 Tax=Shewanella sp. AS16 TaxID=2907625 RepID=UPI001F41F36D|nr:hypothetical protein [Shewanella sp. AS16]MCE9685473.1 hypothetical protein [Shewanella sp. AS16]